MLWFKRNLFFVLSMLLGLGLTGWAVYDNYSLSEKNGTVADDLKTTRDQLKNLQGKSPQPTPENIQATRDDAKRVQEYLDKFHTAFAPFPTPPQTDQRGFKTILETTIEHLRQAASNADVTLPANFNFSFSSQMEKLSYHEDSIEPWLVQLEEIKVICDILFTARITALDSLQRVSVSEDDQGAADYLVGSAISTNQLGTVSPYKITFRGYSEQIAGVLEGFARSSHCWIVKDVDIKPSMAALPVVIPVEQPQQFVPPPRYYRRPSPYGDPRNDPRFQFNGGGGRPVPGQFAGRPMFPRPMMPQEPYAQPTVPLGPVTILSPKILFVSLSLDLVKLKEPEVQTNKPVVKLNVNPRGARGAPPPPLWSFLNDIT